MEENHFHLNQGGASYGLLLKEISDGAIRQNFFEKNTIGILLEGANRLEIRENQFTNNGTAMDMKGNSLDNEVKENNFLGNTFEVVTNTKQNVNTYSGNYWSGYAGYDLDRDGTGDVPYRPVNVFAKITDQIPSATIMLHSTLVNLLEAAEKIFPSLIPIDLVDPRPKMKPYDYH
jgi:nitrous oxidase accessory protein